MATVTIKAGSKGWFEKDYICPDGLRASVATFAKDTEVEVSPEWDGPWYVTVGRISGFPYNHPRILLHKDVVANKSLS